MMNIQVSHEDLESDLMDTTEYRQPIGILMYLSAESRTAVYFSVRIPAKYVEKPVKQLWMFVKRIFQYISVTRDFGIMYDS